MKRKFIDWSRNSCLQNCGLDGEACREKETESYKKARQTLKAQRKKLTQMNLVMERKEALTAQRAIFLARKSPEFARTPHAQLAQVLRRKALLDLYGVANIGCLAMWT
jgi:aminoglycoside phosphotransferase family enzyme